MRVKELIIKLQGCNPNVEIYAGEKGDAKQIRDIVITENVADNDESCVDLIIE